MGTLTRRSDLLFLIGLSLSIGFLVWEAVLWPHGGGSPSCKNCIIADDAGFIMGLLILVVGIVLSLIARRKRSDLTAKPPPRHGNLGKHQGQ